MQPLSTGTQRSVKYWKFNCAHLSMASSWLRSVASRANDIVAETAAAVFEDTDSDYSGSSDGYYEEVEGEEPDGAAAAAARTGGREGAVGVSGQSPRGKGQRPVPGQTLRTEDPLGRGGGGGGIPEKEVPQQRLLRHTTRIA